MNKEIYSKINRENAEEIRKKINQEADYESNEILLRAKKEAERIFAQAKKEIENKKQNVLKDLDKEIVALKERMLSAINLEKKKIVLGEKDRFVEEVIESVKKEAEGFRNSGGYKVFLEKAILEAVNVIDNQNLDIFYSFLDQNIVNDSFMKEIENLCRDRFGENFSLKYQKGDFKDIGIIAVSQDGRLMYDNRFLSRLKRAYEEIYIKSLREIM